MCNELALFNFFFFLGFFFFLSRALGYTVILLIIESLWIILFCLSIQLVPSILDLSLFMFAILVLVLAAVELVLGLLCFIIFYHVVNAVLPTTSPFRTKITTLYTSIFSKTKAFLRTFF